MQLVVATHNRKKLGEIAELLSPQGFAVRSIGEFPGVPETVEDGVTFAENAAKKASEVALALKTWAIGEDSGLCVDALGGEPGVYSARFAGEHGNDAANNALLFRKLDGVPDANRTAHYVCSVAVARPDGTIALSEEARCRGRIVTKPCGDGGFGYDPYFLIPEYHRTFGELSPVVKQILSHRARAFARLVPRLVALAAGGSTSRSLS